MKFTVIHKIKRFQLVEFKMTKLHNLGQTCLVLSSIGLVFEHIFQSFGPNYAEVLPNRVETEKKEQSKL